MKRNRNCITISSIFKRQQCFMMSLSLFFHLSFVRRVGTSTTIGTFSTSIGASTTCSIGTDCIESKSFVSVMFHLLCPIITASRCLSQVHSEHTHNLGTTQGRLACFLHSHCRTRRRPRPTATTSYRRHRSHVTSSPTTARDPTTVLGTIGARWRRWRTSSSRRSRRFRCVSITLNHTRESMFFPQSLPTVRDDVVHRFSG